MFHAHQEKQLQRNEMYLQPWAPFNKAFASIFPHLSDLQTSAIQSPIIWLQIL